MSEDLSYKTTSPSLDGMGDDLAVDGKSYKISELSDVAKSQVANIAFCDGRIQQLNNEWAVADTARLGYLAALRREAKSV